MTVTGSKKAYKRAWLAQRYAAGVCYRCQNPRVEDLTSCEQCRQQDIEYQRARRQAGKGKAIPKSEDRTASTRFWDKVQVKEGCWEWLGARQVRYGNMLYKGTVQLAHRVSWELHFGAIPAGMVVLHVCDNGFCVNPGHLRLGSQVDNVQDAVEKGRWNTPKRLAALRRLHGQSAGER